MLSTYKTLTLYQVRYRRSLNNALVVLDITDDQFNQMSNGTLLPLGVHEVNLETNDFTGRNWFVWKFQLVRVSNE